MKLILQFKYPYWKQANKKAMTEYAYDQEFLNSWWINGLNPAFSQWASMVSA